MLCSACAVSKAELESVLARLVEVKKLAAVLMQTQQDLADTLRTAPV